MRTNNYDASRRGSPPLSAVKSTRLGEEAILDIFDHWQELNGAEDQVLTEKRRDSIEHRLGYPFAAEQLKQALSVVRDDPMVIRRRRDRVDITTVFRSDRRVCQALGIAYQKPDDSWLLPFEATWRHEYDREFWWTAAERLRYAHQLVGTESLHASFKRYCAATPWESARLQEFVDDVLNEGWCASSG